MKTVQALVVSAAMATGMAAPASAATTDPEVVIYRFPGVTNNIGIATVFHCTNFSGAEETIRFVTRDFDSTIKSNATGSIPHLTSVTFATQVVSAYLNEKDFGNLVVSQGTTAIAATSINIICTAMTIDSSAQKPVGVSLRGIRFNPAPGSQE